MEPRILVRTHYQVDEPAFAELIIAKCTSPVTSAYDDSIAERLVREVRSRRKSFNVAAARYAVGLGHRLNIIGSNNIWLDNGHLVNLIADVGDHQWGEELPLTMAEKLLHFRLFLEADGAALLFLAKHLVTNREVPSNGLDWNSLARDMFLVTYSDYLLLTTPTAERIAIRSRLERLKARGYRGKSGPHKLFMHMQVLHRLGFVNRKDSPNERRYSVSDRGYARLHRLIEVMPSVGALEEVVRGDRCVEIAADVLGLSAREKELCPRELLRWLVPMYEQVIDTGIPLCPLRPIIEAAQISLITEASHLTKYEHFINMLRKMQSTHLRDIRFHQNRRGELGFLVISNDLVQKSRTYDGNRAQ